jgi:hypothetical protein
LKLLKDFEIPKDQENSTEETNVKRRVYDALNVLIAVGILQKDGRKIVSKTGKNGSITNHLELELNSLQRKLNEKEQTVEEKREKLRQAKEKLKCIQDLIKKNKANKGKAERSGRLINFPFVGATDFNKYRQVGISSI